MSEIRTYLSDLAKHEGRVDKAYGIHRKHTPHSDKLSFYAGYEAAYSYFWNQNPAPADDTRSIGAEAVARIIAENLPTPYAQDLPWRQTDDGAIFDLSRVDAPCRDEWITAAKAVMSAVAQQAGVTGSASATAADKPVPIKEARSFGINSQVIGETVEYVDGSKRTILHNAGAHSVKARENSQMELVGIIERLFEALSSVKSACDNSAWHNVFGVSMKRILVTQASIDRTNKALEAAKGLYVTNASPAPIKSSEAVK